MEDLGSPYQQSVCDSPKCKTPIHCSPFQDPRAWAVDVFLRLLKLDFYTFTPFALLRKVLTKLWVLENTMMTTAHCWPPKGMISWATYPGGRPSFPSVVQVRSRSHVRFHKKNPYASPDCMDYQLSLTGFKIISSIHPYASYNCMDCQMSFTC